MKIVERSLEVVKKFDVDYENGIICKCTTINGVLKDYMFFGSFVLKYVESIEEIRNTHWSKHCEVIEKQKNLTLTQIKNFTNFDKLFYIGGSRDGMTKDKDGVFISTPIFIDEIISQCWFHIETKKERCQEIIDSLNEKYVTNSSIIEIPYYNRNNDKKNHFTLNLTIKLPDDLYNKFMGKKNHLDDAIKVEIFNFLKIKE